MFKKLVVFSAMIALVAAFAGGLRTAQAYATVDYVQGSCSSLVARGTTDSPYVWLYVSYPTGEYWEVFPANADGTFAHSITFPEQAEGTGLGYEVWGAPTGTTVINDPGYWDGGDYYYSFHACTKTVPGPSIPSGFVLHTITCDTALYAEPAGALIADAKITAGQTWYVNPTPKKAADGSNWSEIFVGSYNDAFIPTGCVN
jgi:hypothetical protein